MLNTYAHAAYPTETDLEMYLAAAGLVVTDLPLGNAIRAGIGEVEHATSRTWLAAATATERRFDPPTGPRSFLSLRGDAAAITSVVYAAGTMAPTTLALNTDYWLYPQSAPALGRPYTALRFQRRWYEPLLPAFFQSLRVTARWGYSDLVPHSVWQLMLTAGALAVQPQLAAAVAGGLVSWTEANVTENYGGDPLGHLATQWRETLKGLKQYQRVEGFFS